MISRCQDVGRVFAAIERLQVVLSELAIPGMAVVSRFLSPSKARNVANVGLLCVQIVVRVFGACECMFY